MTLFGLIDGNSFYCSCERAFDPKLRNVPLVVLSNNDGCVIARSNEAKDIGVAMGEPWHLAKERPETTSVAWRSSNYALYGDMSRRVYELLLERAPRVEPYSIDEMFLDLDGLPGDRVERCTRIRADVRALAKIPTCVGIGPTKTIAKLANKVAKKDRAGSGVCDFAEDSARLAAYRDLGLNEVWGIGRASLEKLKRLGAESIADFVALPPDTVRQMLTVTGLRTHAELRGVSCMPLSTVPADRKSLAVTRSFSRPIDRWPELEQAVATYAAKAGARLRSHGLTAGAMQVFMHTNPFKPGEPQHAPSQSFDIEPTADTLALLGSATRAARRMWRPGYRYIKAGIILLDLRTTDTSSLFPSRDPERSAKLMRALDAVNARYGRDALRPAMSAPKASWGMKRSQLSPRYTTHADEMLTVRA